MAFYRLLGRIPGMGEVMIVRKDKGETGLGVVLYWLLIYVFAILFGGVAEAAANSVSKLALGFSSGRLSATWHDAGLLLAATAVFFVILTGALVVGDNLLGRPLENTSRWFKAFTLAFVFLGSNIFYEIVVLTRAGMQPK